MSLWAICVSGGAGTRGVSWIHRVNFPLPFQSQFMCQRCLWPPDTFPLIAMSAAAHLGPECALRGRGSCLSLCSGHFVYWIGQELRESRAVGPTQSPAIPSGDIAARPGSCGLLTTVFPETRSPRWPRSVVCADSPTPEPSRARAASYQWAAGTSWSARRISGRRGPLGKHSLGLAAPPLLGVPAVDAGHGEASCRQGRSHGPLCSPDATLQLLQAAEVACADVRAVPALCQPEPGAGVAWEFRGEERLGCGSSLTVATRGSLCVGRGKSQTAARPAAV